MINGLGSGMPIHPRDVARQLAPEQLAPGGQSDEARLKEAVEALEGVFVQELTKALRATVPNGGNPDAPGSDMYASLLDEHLAQIVASDTKSGISEVLYRQLSGGRELYDAPGTRPSASSSVQGRSF